MEIQLSNHAEKLLTLLKDRLHASDTEVIEEAIIRLFRECQEESSVQELIDSEQPTTLMEAMDRSGLLD